MHICLKQKLIFVEKKNLKNRYFIITESVTQHLKNMKHCKSFYKLFYYSNPQNYY